MNLKNSANLGDNLLQLNFMRRACRQHRELEFNYYCNPDYHAALLDFVDKEWSDQFRLLPLSLAPAGTLDTWIAAPCHNGFYHRHPLQREYPQFYVDFFAMLGHRLGFASPIKSVQDVLLEHPAFSADDRTVWDGGDVLVLDCPAKSGQFEFVAEDWARAVHRWRNLGHKVVTVGGMGWSLLEIGRLAVHAKHVIGVGTGPLHAAFNTVSINSVARWDIFDHCHNYRYNDRVRMHGHGLELLRISP